MKKQTGFSSKEAVIALGKKFATVINEPSLREFKKFGEADYIAHFLARDDDCNLVECTAYHDKALKVAHKLNIGDRIVADMEVKITPAIDALEYKYSGYFICANKYL